MRLVRRRRKTVVAAVAALVIVAAVLALLGLTRSGAGSTQRADVVLRELYVAPNGSDASNGSKERPWRTLQKALSQVRPGDVVFLRSGTYSEFATLFRSGAEGRTITVRAYPGEKPVITGRFKITGDWVRVIGLTFRGGVANQGDVLVYVSGADHVRITRNEIAEAELSGIFVDGGSSDLRVVANWIHDNGQNDFLDHGIYLEQGTGALISTNLIDGNAAYGVHLYPDADGNVVAHNTIVGNGRSGIIVGGESTTSERNTIVNNIVAFNGEFGIRTFWGGPVGADNTADRNLVFANEEGAIDGLPLAVGSNLEDDPQFVDAEGGDFHLEPTSPARDRAREGFALGFDFDGRTRPRGERSDLGAFER